jgi:hypothetical protein
LRRDLPPGFGDPQPDSTLVGLGPYFAEQAGGGELFHQLAAGRLMDRKPLRQFRYPGIRRNGDVAQDPDLRSRDATRRFDIPEVLSDRSIDQPELSQNRELQPGQVGWGRVV